MYRRGNGWRIKEHSRRSIGRYRRWRDNAYTWHLSFNSNTRANTEIRLSMTVDVFTTNLPVVIASERRHIDQMNRQILVAPVPPPTVGCAQWVVVIIVIRT
jgi:hypothetical protein